MGLSSLVKRIVPTAIGLATGGPLGAVAGAISADQGARAEKKARIQNEIATNEFYKSIRRNNMSLPGISRNLDLERASRNAGFGSSFGNFLTEASTNILGPIGTFASGLKGLFGGGDRPPSVITQPALTTVTNVGAQESQTSGVNEAFVGGLGPVLQQAGRLIGGRVGQIAGGIGTGAGAVSLFGGGDTKLRVTRKMKRLAQQAYQLAMGDLGGATTLFAQLSGVQVDQRTFVLILTKRFRNDGPVVTKAALRKTKTTIRRLKNMCDMYDSLRPRATARRRTTPMKRANVSLIKN
jgi:hypothetical protein